MLMFSDSSMLPSPSAISHDLASIRAATASADTASKAASRTWRIIYLLLGMFRPSQQVYQLAYVLSLVRNSA